MIPEIGHFALVLALCLALVQSTFPLIGAWRENPAWSGVAVPAARAQALFVAIAFGVLTYAFLVGDFSVDYVATNSNSRLPMMYRIAAVWGAHEGSMLLWAMTLAAWTFAVTLFSRQLPESFRVRVVAVMGLVSVGFLLFILWTSNPFTRLIPAPMEGGDLNPLLQDVGMAIHPPLLYMGYVGLAVPFAFALAALLDGRLDAAWIRWTRPWCIVAWTFLTLGIMVGSWWAYYELGWGGWWFWDPVENASFMPWLVATGLMHSLAVTEQRGAFKAWTVLLAIFGFSLSLLGTFLVRSGVLVSVHAFASDPARGLFILIFLCLVIGGSLALFAWRGAVVSGGGNFSLVSRETLLLVNNVLLTVASASVLLGTMYPLFLDALELGKISVGPPYFEGVFVPLMLPLIAVLGVGPLTRWKRDTAPRLARTLGVVAVLSVVLGAVMVALATDGPFKAMVAVSLVLAFWVMLSSIQVLVTRLRHKSDRASAMGRLPRAFLGMLVAHFGMGIFIIGAALTGAYSVERDVSMGPGSVEEIAGYRFRFGSMAEFEGPNYRADRAEIEVFRGDRKVATLYPEKRHYPTQGQPMTEASIDAGVTRDLYVAIGEPLGNGAWAVRLYHKPFIRWLWFGPILMALGGLLSASDRRYRIARRAREVENTRATSGDRVTPTGEARA